MSEGKLRFQSCMVRYMHVLRSSYVHYVHFASWTMKLRTANLDPKKTLGWRRRQAPAPFPEKAFRRQNLLNQIWEAWAGSEHSTEVRSTIIQNTDLVRTVERSNGRTIPVILSGSTHTLGRANKLTTRTSPTFSPCSSYNVAVFPWKTNRSSRNV